MHFLISGVMDFHVFFSSEKHEISFIPQMPLESSKNGLGQIPQEDVRKDVMWSCSAAAGLWDQKSLSSAIQL